MRNILKKNIKNIFIIFFLIVALLSLVKILNNENETFGVAKVLNVTEKKDIVSKFEINERIFQVKILVLTGKYKNKIVNIKNNEYFIK